MASYSSFDDYFDLDALTKKYVGVDIVTMEEFLTKEAAAGRLQAGGGGKFVDSRSIAMGLSLQPPSGKVDWNGDGDLSHLFDYLEQVALTPAWDFDTCIASFPMNIEDGTAEANLGLNKMMSGIVRRIDGRPKPSPQSFRANRQQSMRLLSNGSEKSWESANCSVYTTNLCKRRTWFISSSTLRKEMILQMTITVLGIGIRVFSSKITGMICSSRGS